MSMQKKLEKAYKQGYEDGQAASNKLAIEMAREHGIKTGSIQTWDIVEEMIPQLEGIGPRTTEKIMEAVRAFAKKEFDRLNN